METTSQSSDSRLAYPAPMDFLLWMAGGGSIYPGEEITILDKHNTTALAAWDKPVLFGKGHWEVVGWLRGAGHKVGAVAAGLVPERAVAIPRILTLRYLLWCGRA